MKWMPYRLRDADVWAKVDANGQLVPDSTGRVEIVYKPGDGAKVYRAGARNLSPRPGEAAEFEATERAPEASKTAASPAAAAAAATAKAPANAIHVWTDGACTGNPGP